MQRNCQLKFPFLSRIAHRNVLGFLLIGILSALSAANVQSAGTDYFLTIGGGYEPQGNQASLEANVLFFQEVVAEQHRGARNSSTFFADGYDDAPDLQVAVEEASEQGIDTTEETASATPATDLLGELYRFRGPFARKPVYYRNHRVPNVAGPIKPSSIRGSLARLTQSMAAGDRLFIYVTAHGGSAKGRNGFNTTISCWDKESISVRDFETWLDDVPDSVPVIMVMAQCYCGGFAHSIFDKADASTGLSQGNRIGFFAQQHDLAAAGCRPDIENDEEYSSFFWGAIAGRMRNGKAIQTADLDGDGRVSFSEAHAYAMLASDTIDIPMTASDALLRAYSKIDGYDPGRNAYSRVAMRLNLDSEGERSSDLNEFEMIETTMELAKMEGKISDVLDDATLTQRRVVEGLLGQLGLSSEDSVGRVFEEFAEARRAGRSSGRGSRGGRRGRGGRGGSFSARRELLTEIAESFPSLADRESWEDSELLRPANQNELFAQLVAFPSYRKFQDAQSSFRQAMEQRQSSELQSVKFRRLIETLETIVLAKNLSKVADESISEKYQAMLRLENTFLDPFADSGLRRY